MPLLLLIGIPIAVVVLFMGIMSLPDEDAKKRDTSLDTQDIKSKKKKK